MSKENDHMTVWQRWMFLGIFVDTFAIYGVASLALRDEDRGMKVAAAFCIVATSLLIVAFIDARLEARDRRRRPKPSLIGSNWDRDEVRAFWVD